MRISQEDFYYKFLLRIIRDEHFANLEKKAAYKTTTTYQVILEYFSCYVVGNITYDTDTEDLLISYHIKGHCKNCIKEIKDLLTPGGSYKCGKSVME